MHHIYRTKGIILSSKPRGESGKYLTVLSSDHGMLKIEAQAVRSVNSKLRQAIQDYSICDISFVRGKTGNRLVNAQFNTNFFYQFTDETVLKSISNIFSLTQKMVIDEDPASTIFKILTETLNFLKENEKNLSPKFLKALETTIVYKILWNLGYISKDNLHGFLISDELGLDLIEKVMNLGPADQKEIIRLINQAISESHL